MIQSTARWRWRSRGWAPPALNFEIVEISDLPLYSEEAGVGTVPAAWKRFRAEIRDSDAVLFVTAEHNRSLSAAVKNALDVGSCLSGENVWDGKPGAVVGVALRAVEGFGVNHHIYRSLAQLNLRVMQKLEVQIGSEIELFDVDGELTDSSQERFLIRQFVEALSF